MATIKFLLQSTKNPAPVYVRFSIGRGKTFKRKTGHVTNPATWNSKHGRPKSMDGASNNFKMELSDLENHIIGQYNKDYKTGVTFSGDWLQTVIEKFYNRTEPDNLSYLIAYGEKFITDLPYKITAKGKRGVEKSTIGKYKEIVEKLRRFQEHEKVQLLVKDVDIDFRTAFIKYLETVENLSDNTIGRAIRFVKTIVLDARDNDIEVSPKIYSLKGYTRKTPKVTLTFEDITKLKEAIFENEILDAARDWLVISCYTAQRGSDLLRMNPAMVQKHKNRNLIFLQQKKTEKPVIIPMHPEVKRILDKRNGQFPEKQGKEIRSQNAMLNRHLKTVCFQAGLTDIVEGNLKNPETGKYETGYYPKWMLVASHIGRRSFATNLYGKDRYATPLLMNVTGHVTEKMFLEYNGKQSLDYAMQLAEIWENEG